MKSIEQDSCPTTKVNDWEKFLGPISGADFSVFSDEFDNLTVSGYTLTKHFKIDCKKFMHDMDTELKYVNFLPIEQQGKLSFMIHLSNNKHDISSGDKLFFFKHLRGDDYELEEETNLNIYATKKTEYNQGLGKAIDEVTCFNHGCNTRIIIHKNKSVKNFHKDLRSVLAPENILYLDFRMIQLKDIPESDEREYFRNYERKIAFAVSLRYKNPITNMEQSTEYYDIADLHP